MPALLHLLTAPQDDEAREVKVVLLGQTGVGKSSIVLRFVTNQFDKNSDATIGCVGSSRLVFLSFVSLHSWLLRPPLTLPTFL